MQSAVSGPTPLMPRICERREFNSRCFRFSRLKSDSCLRNRENYKPASPLYCNIRQDESIQPTLQGTKHAWPPDQVNQRPQIGYCLFHVLPVGVLRQDGTNSYFERSIPRPPVARAKRRIHGVVHFHEYRHCRHPRTISALFPRPDRSTLRL